METRKTENRAFVVGLLKRKELSFKKDSQNRDYVGGSLILLCETPLGIGEVKVRVMQYAITSTGKENTLYKGICTVEKEYKSIEEVGQDNADLIKVEGSIEDNTYFSTKTNEFVESIEIKGVFFNRLDKEKNENLEHCCKAGIEGVITKIIPVNDEVEVEITGIGYKGVAVPVKGMIQKELVPVFMGNYTVGSTATLNFAFLNIVETQQVQEVAGFGEALGEVITKTIRKKIIFGGSPVNYSTPISEEEIKRAIAIREANLVEKREKALNTENNSFTPGFATPTNSTPMGFNTAYNGFGMPTGTTGV